MVGKKNSEKFRMVVTLTFEKEKKARSRRFFGPTKCRVKKLKCPARSPWAFEIGTTRTFWSGPVGMHQFNVTTSLIG